MEAPNPTPLTPQQECLLRQLIGKLTGWSDLLKMGKPGANQVRKHIEAELAEYQRKLERERPCHDCVGTGRGSATDPIIPCGTCKGSGLANLEVAA